VVLAIGSGHFAGQSAAWPSIPFAEEDARDVAAFLGAPGGTRRYRRVDLQTIVGPDATTQRILDALDQLEARRRKGELGQGDSVMVLVESHFLSCERHGQLLASDSAPGLLKTPSVPADRFAEILGQLADYGCQVMLLVDALHENRPDPRQGNRAANEWARDLYRRNVITFVASIHGPSQRVLSEAHGAFAQGILDVLNVRAQARLQADPKAPLTLFGFRDAVARRVLDLTGRRQHARCFVPETIPSQLPVFDPPLRRQPRLLRASID
jgi:hypothetical protein